MSDPQHCMSQPAAANLKHLGIVMDGNGRWAKQRGLPRFKGHDRGVKVAKEMISAAIERGIAYLSLYVFSTENWRRQGAEVGHLFSLMVKHLRSELPFYRRENVRLWHSGRRDQMPAKVLKELDQMVSETAAHHKITVNLLIDYGGHDELCRAVERWRKLDKTCCNVEDLQACLDHGSELPEVDLLIRSGGEMRLSNFLLWKCAYSEFYFSPTLWPDWNSEELDRALMSFTKRQRRYGLEG